MGNISTGMLILVFLVIGIVFIIVLLAVGREALFWYWRSKGILNAPTEISRQTHDTAIFIRKTIDGLKNADAANKVIADQSILPPRQDKIP